MIFSAALDPRFCRLSFLSESQQSELLELLVSAAESISCNTASATNESNDAAQSAEPPSRSKVYWIVFLVRKSWMMSQVSKMK